MSKTNNQSPLSAQQGERAYTTGDILYASCRNTLAKIGSGSEVSALCITDELKCCYCGSPDQTGKLCTQCGGNPNLEGVI